MAANAPSHTADAASGLLASLLASIRLRSTVYFRPEYHAPWGVRLDRPIVAFHLIASGQCWLHVDGDARPTRLEAGDLVVFPRRHPHELRDSPATPVVDFFGLAKRHCVAGGWFRTEGPGPVTTMVCGALQFADGPAEPLLAVLPAVLHASVRSDGPRSSLALTAQQLLEELEATRPGFESVVTRLGDILFIQAVRSHFEQSLGSDGLTWASAIRDAHVGPALALLHREPARRWTVASLAARVGLSRSTFASRFSELLGEPPLRYLTRIRLHLAAAMLRDGDAKLSAVAASSGYESIAAFDKAFKRHAGVSPGAYRRAASKR
jgi:AraC-like DNA-binding protein